MVVDSIVLAIFLISAFVAFWRGFIREFVTIVGAGGGLLAAWSWGPFLKPFMHNLWGVTEGQNTERLFGLIPYGFVADALGYLFVFVAVFAILSFLSHVLSEKARAVGLGPVDRTLGVLFGLVRGLIIVGLLYLPIHLWGGKEEKKKWFEGSTTHVYVEATAAWLASFLPQDQTPKKQNDPTPDHPSEPAQDTLKAIETLKALSGTLAPSDAKDAPKDSPTPSGPGYSDAPRKKLDSLIDTENSPEETPKAP